MYPNWIELSKIKRLLPLILENQFVLKLNVRNPLVFETIFTAQNFSKPAEFIYKNCFDSLLAWIKLIIFKLQRGTQNVNLWNLLERRDYHYEKWATMSYNSSQLVFKKYITLVIYYSTLLKAHKLFWCWLPRKCNHKSNKF
jgi:hypothetical protein